MPSGKKPRLSKGYQDLNTGEIVDDSEISISWKRVLLATLSFLLSAAMVVVCATAPSVGIYFCMLVSIVSAITAAVFFMDNI